MKTTRNIILKETGRVHLVKQFPTFLVNDGKEKDPTDIANAFNNLFIIITEKLNIQQIQEGDAISLLKDSLLATFPA
jgi:hypothetical protein